MRECDIFLMVEFGLIDAFLNIESQHEKSYFSKKNIILTIRFGDMFVRQHLQRNATKMVSGSEGVCSSWAQEGRRSITIL